MIYDPTSYVDQSLTKVAYTQTYTVMIHRIYDEKTWQKIDVYIMMPLNNGRKPRKPKVLRRRELTEPLKEVIYFKMWFMQGFWS